MSPPRGEEALQAIRAWRAVTYEFTSPVAVRCFTESSNDTKAQLLRAFYAKKGERLTVLVMESPLTPTYPSESVTFGLLPYPGGEVRFMATLPFKDLPPQKSDAKSGANFVNSRSMPVDPKAQSVITLCQFAAFRQPREGKLKTVHLNKMLFLEPGDQVRGLPTKLGDGVQVARFTVQVMFLDSEAKLAKSRNLDVGEHPEEVQRFGTDAAIEKTLRANSLEAHELISQP